MATNLTDEFLKQLQNHFAQQSGGGYRPNVTMDMSDGKVMQAIRDTSGPGGEAGYDNSLSAPTVNYINYTARDDGKYKENDQLYNLYGVGGEDMGLRAFKEDNWKANLAAMIITAISMGTLAPAAAGMAGAEGAAVGAAGAGGLGGAGGVGAGAAAAGDAFLPGMLAAQGGAAVPYGALLPGLEGYAAAGAGLAGTGGFNAAADSQLANLGIEATGGNPLAGYAGTGGVSASPLAGAGGGSSGGGLWDKVTSAFGGGGGSGLSGQNLLGLASTALGAVGGAKGNDASTSATKTLPDYLQGPVANELVPWVRQLLNQQMPQAMQTGQFLRDKGTSMLNQPMAGNGFSRFYG